MTNLQYSVETRRAFDDESLDSDGLWEEVLNPLLKSTLDWV